MIPFSLISFAMADASKINEQQGQWNMKKQITCFRHMHNAMAFNLFYALICMCFEKSYEFRKKFSVRKVTVKCAW